MDLPEINRQEIENLIGFLNTNIAVKITVMEKRIRDLEFELKSLKNQGENSKIQNQTSLIRYLSEEED